MRVTSILHAVVIVLVTLISPSSVWSTSAKNVFDKVSSSVVVVLALDKRGKVIAQGSGVVVGKYEVVTNCHVLDKATDIRVRQAAHWSGGKDHRMAAFLLARNDKRDLCLLFVEELPIPPVARPARLGAAKELSIGEEVYAVGAPAGLELSLSRGIVSQLRSVFGKRSAPLIQTDAAVSSGSSGGGLFNHASELVGITTFKWRGENLNFAIPAEWVKELRAQGRAKLIKAKRRATCMTNPTYVCVMDLALHAANRTENFLLRFEQLRNIAAAQKEMGDIQGARQTLNAAAHEASSTTGIFEIVGVKNLLDITVAQIKLGDEKTAIQTFTAFTTTALGKTAQKIIDNPSHPSRNQVLAFLASALAKAGDVANSLEVFSRITDSDNHRSRVLSHIARAQVKAGDVANAIKTAISIKNNFHRNRALLMVSNVQAKAGDFGGAMKTVRRIDDVQFQGVGLFRIAGWQLISGKIKAADQTINMVSASDSPNPLFYLLSPMIQAKKGNFSGAITIVDSLPRNQDGGAIRIALLSEIAVMQARAGRALDAKQALSDAFRVAHARGDAKGRAVLLSTVAAAQAKAGDPETAKQTFAQAIAAFESARKKDAPNWMLRSDPHSLPSYRCDAFCDGRILRADLRMIAQAQAKAGFFEDAIKTTLSIDVMQYRVEALVDITRYLMGKPPPPFWDPRRSDF